MKVPVKHLALMLGVSSLVACSGQDGTSDGPGPNLDGAVPALEVEVKHGTLESQFPDVLKPSDDIAVRRGSAQLKFGLRMIRFTNARGVPIAQTNLSQSEATKMGQNVVYRGVSQKADLVYKVLHNEVEQLFILNEQPMLPEEAEWMELVEEVDFSGLQVFDGGELKQLPARFDTSGPINLVKDQVTMFRIPKPVVRDASASRARTDLGFRIALNEEGKGVLSTKVPVSYLYGINRMYPVVIDPAVQGHPCDVDAHCDDQNPCTDDSCVAGGCEYAPSVANDGASCQFSGVCVTDPPANPADPETWCDHSATISGPANCTLGGANVCRDGNPCTNDTCLPSGACDNSPAPGQVGNPCWDTGVCGDTVGDGSGAATGECVFASQCTSDDACKTGKKCVDEVCVAGQCVEQNSAAYQGLPCLGTGTCDTGVCVLPPVGGECGGPGLAATACNDGNPCTVDSCDDNLTPSDTSDDNCVNAPVPGGDGNGDTVRDTCYESGKCDNAGNCVFCGAGLGFDPDVCDDANPCTTDSCVGGACDHSPIANGTPCLTGGLCNAGLCVIPGAGACCGAKACNDGNPCTTDTCLPDGTCQNSPVADGPICWSTGVCTAGMCIYNPQNACSTNGAGNGGGPLSCDDGNPCTADACEPDGSCSHIPQNDGNTCWSSGTCGAGVCTF